MTDTVLMDSPAPASSPQVARKNRVVVGIDDHPASLAALRFAATEAAYRGADVLALHAWHRPYTWGLPTAWPEYTDLTPYVAEQMVRTVEQVVTERAAAGEPVVAIVAEIVEGDASTALDVAAGDAVLLVLGARHHNRLIGSVSQLCATHPACPVVVVPVPPE